MSGLAGLFEEEDGGDINSLRYVAPKAPKPKKKKSSAEKNNNALSTDNTKVIEKQSELESYNKTDKKEDEEIKPVATTTTGKAPKVLTYASVRLYQVNSNTGEYEACAGGNLLGCIIIGIGIKYQILIYDENRTPQATTPISIGFNYNVSNLYMTFYDPRNVYYAVLFDSKETIQKYIRNLMAVKINMAQASESSAIVSGLISSEEVTEASTLDTGAIAGVNISIWETISIPSDAYVIDLSETTPLHTVTNEKDLTKIDVTNSTTSSVNDVIGGIGSAISGFKKGDTIILGIPPHLNQKGSIDLSSRKDSKSWMMVEVKILRVKSAKKNTKKLSFADEKVQAQQEVQEVQVQQEQEQQAETEVVIEEPETPAPTTTLAERMAKISRQAGGGMQALAVAMGNQAVKQNKPKLAETEVIYDESSDPNPKNIPIKNTTGDSNDTSINVKRHVVDKEKEKDEETNEKEVIACHKKPDESALAVAAVATVLQSSPVKEKKENSMISTPASPASTPTVFPAHVAAAPVTSSVSNTASDTVVTQERYTLPSNVMSAADSEKHFSQMQNSLSSLFYGITQLQTKVDQVATTISQSNSNSNQNQGNMVAGSTGAESALVMQLQQMLQLQQMNMLSGGAGMGVGTGVAKRNSINLGSPGFVDSCDTSSSIRHNETVAAVEQLYKDYEEVCDQLKEEKNKKIESSNNNNSNSQADREALIQSEERCRQLEERTNKLMDEKSTLLEKQSSILQRLSDAHDRADDLRAETEKNNSKIGRKVVDVLTKELREIINTCEGLDRTIQSSLITQMEDVIQKHT